MNKRVLAIAMKIRKGRIVADIGTDHAQLPVYLAENGICNRVYACDLREGPLAMARENIRKKGLEEKITAILCDGITAVPHDADCIVIAGMGYHTAVMILENDLERLPECREIIVQVNDDVPGLRRWISEHSYTILDEILVSENGKDYVAVFFNTAPHCAYSEEEILCGPILMEEDSDAFHAFCRRNADKLQRIMNYRKGDESLEELQVKHDLWLKHTEK